VARSDVIRQATLAYAAGRITLAEWRRCVAQFGRARGGRQKKV
jgi:hypothetical protein